jgi:hypothetical protein
VIDLRTALWLVAGATLVGGAVLLFAFDPAETAIFPPCVFHLATGLLCPGCGLTRALHELLHGNLAAAMELNALLPVYLLLLGTLVAGAAWRHLRGTTPRMLRVSVPTISTAGAAMILFGIVRNF